MINTATLQRYSPGGGAPSTVYDSSWMAVSLTRLQATSQASALSSDGVAFMVATPCLLLMDTACPAIMSLYQLHPPSGPFEDNVYFCICLLPLRIHVKYV